LADAVASGALTGAGGADSASRREADGTPAGLLADPGPARAENEPEPRPGSAGVAVRLRDPLRRGDITGEDGGHQVTVDPQPLLQIGGVAGLRIYQ
jgi:hypothetical protein